MPWCECYHLRFTDGGNWATEKLSHRVRKGQLEFKPRGQLQGPAGNCHTALPFPWLTFTSGSHLCIPPFRARPLIRCKYFPYICGCIPSFHKHALSATLYQWGFCHHTPHSSGTSSSWLHPMPPPLMTMIFVATLHPSVGLDAWPKQSPSADMLSLQMSKNLLKVADALRNKDRELPVA